MLRCCCQGFLREHGRNPPSSKLSCCLVWEGHGACLVDAFCHRVSDDL